VDNRLSNTMAGIMEKMIEWSLSSFLGALFSAFVVNGYLKKKGENLATHEDIDKLVDQVCAVTTATKEIETMISDKAWGRQKQWEMKRDALVTALQALERADDALMEMALAFGNASKADPENEVALRQMKWEKTSAWQSAIGDLDDKRVMVNLVCTKAGVQALRVAAKGMRTDASRLFKGQISTYDEIGEVTQRHIVEAFSIARTELGIDAE
jgi:hypothetical protein